MQVYPWKHFVMAARFFHSANVSEFVEAQIYDPARDTGNTDHSKNASNRKLTN